MLSRRHFRIKTLQALYAFFLSESDQVAYGEKMLINSVDKLHELFVLQLSLLVEINEFARQRIEDAKGKYFPTEEDLHPNLRFIENPFILALTVCPDYLKYHQKYHVNWSLYPETIKRLYLSLSQSPEFVHYMKEPDKPATHLAFTGWMINHVFDNNETLADIFEDKNIFWGADFDLSVFLLHKTLRYFQQQHFRLEHLPSIYKEDEESRKEDLDFMRRLFRQTILHNAEYEELIEKKLENWELERIAVMDRIILKMALCELIEFQSIPVKVTLNEYIEITKSFSTPRSNHFVNGILDKLMIQLVEEKKIVKRGRGLME
ncbi:MAG TPA: transcription antitermination factor NusB [Bacteroidales bacterium]|nr:transcription antitermination factor NusB [Bacteroidales bacterium]HSA42620.1 transcription antitermination factor NusB [Bacteroidales bacterium]